MKRKKLEMVLQSIPNIPAPVPELEQYSTPAIIAADILFLAFANGDLESKTVVDLGCGTGTFAIGAKLLGAERVWGCDCSRPAIEIAQKSAENLGLEIHFELAEVSTLEARAIKFNDRDATAQSAPVAVDTVLENPPFGAQKTHADRIFLKKAIEIGRVVYSLHLRNTRTFIRHYVTELGARISHEEDFVFPIKHTFMFHSLPKKDFEVTLYRIERN